MTTEEKCKLAIERGYTYNPETGLVIGPRGNLITRKTSTGYVEISTKFKNKQLRLRTHQFGWYCVNKQCVEQLDHINGVRDDNRISNIRAVTNQQNQWNRTKAKGYSWDKNRNKWKSNIRLNNKTIFLGRYDNEEDARQAYLDAKEKYHIIKNPHQEG
jgi:hypothetical protein